MKKANALYCSLRQRWWKIGLRFIITGAGTPGRPAWTCFVWSYALPITVFQPNLNLILFGHDSHVSRSFYGFMLRRKGHCLLVLRHEHVSANGKQSNTIIAAQYHATQLFESLRRHTAPMQYKLKYTYKHSSGLKITLYMVHLSSALQTVECKIQSMTVLQKSSKKVRAVALRLSQTGNITLECNETTPKC